MATKRVIKVPGTPKSVELRQRAIRDANYLEAKARLNLPDPPRRSPPERIISTRGKNTVTYQRLMAALFRLGVCLSIAAYWLYHL
jgi:hypothetical protein